MAIEKIIANDLKRLSRIGDRKYQQRYGEYLIEGVRLVEEAFRAGADVLELAVTSCAERRGRVKRLIESATKKGLPIRRVNNREMARICRTENNQGIAAGVSLPSKSKGEIYGELLQIKSGLIVFLDGIQDPGNVGTIIRTSEAFGVEGVILGAGSAGLFNPKTLRSAMGAVFRVDVVEIHDESPVEIINGFSKNGFQIVATCVGGGYVSFREADFSEKIVLIIGSESAGVSEKLIEKADLRIEIPMPGPTESLNAAVAGSILIHFIKSEMGY
ncbi:hypothetical protein DRQ36_09020 [bacterium]|nr:MAG: hypothetical protein DRQ36_09020 [bacterium]